MILQFFAIFALVWWTVLLMILPIGVHVSKTPDQGHASSAPSAPRIWKKIGITTLISIVLTVIIVVIINHPAVKF